QVYALARHLGLPDVICNTVPTTDTYSMPQGQDEFYYPLPYKEMDIALWCYNHKKPAAALGKILEISEAQAQYVYNDTEGNRRTTAPQHLPAILTEDVELICSMSGPMLALEIRRIDVEYGHGLTQFKS